MKSTKISNDEIKNKKVSSLPTRPTAKSAFGGAGLTPTELKAAFDALPMLLIERYNSLLDDLTACPEDSITTRIKTGISDTHTLYDLFYDLVDGTLSTYLSVGDTTLALALADIEVRLKRLEERRKAE